MRYNLQFFALAFMMTGAAAFFQTTGAERIERITPGIPPTWLESSGAHIEVRGTYTAMGDASVVLRLPTEAQRPFTLLWGSNDGWQMNGGGSLPRDVADLEGERPREPQTVAWRLTIRGLGRSAQHVRLETQAAGASQIVLEKDLPLQNLREWVEAGAELVFGFAGEVVLADASIKTGRDGTVFLLR